MTVLEGLRHVKEAHSPTLAWRSSCRMGVCGSCGMFINGRPRLACNTQISELGTSAGHAGAAAELQHDPRPGARPRADVRGARGGQAVHHPRRRRRAAAADRRVLAVARTSSRSTCSSPTASSAAAAWPPARPTRPTRSIPGPMPLGAGAPLQRRQPRRRVRGPQGSAGGRAAARGAATSPANARRVCPKGVDPARAIQLMKRQLVFDYLKLWKQPCPAPLGEDAGRREAARRHPRGAAARLFEGEGEHLAPLGVLQLNRVRRDCERPRSATGRGRLPWRTSTARPRRSPPCERSRPATRPRRSPTAPARAAPPPRRRRRRRPRASAGPVRRRRARAT